MATEAKVSNELALYSNELNRLLDSLIDSIGGLDEVQLNWRPPAPDSNSCYVIATHVLGNLEAWVLGIACGQPIERDRPAEFAAAGPTVAPIAARARKLAGEFERALGELRVEALDEQRQPPKTLWGVGTPEPRSTREALMETIEHAAVHIGQIQITRDLALAGVRG